MEKAQSPMTVRTCPHCHYQYSVTDYYKKFFLKFGWSEWNCMNCGKKISFDMKRRLVLAILMSVLFFVTAVVIKNIALTMELKVGLGIVLLAGILFIFSFETFKKV